MDAKLDDSSPISITWDFLYTHILTAKRYDLAESITSGHFHANDGERFDVTGIDPIAGKVVCHNPKDGTAQYTIQVLAQNKISPLIVSSNTLSNSFLQLYDKHVRSQRASREPIKTYNRSTARRSNDSVSPVKVRSEGYETPPKFALADETKKLAVEYAPAREHFVETASIDLSENIEVLIPVTIDWEEVLTAEGEIKTRNHIRTILEFDGIGDSSYLRPCSAFRSLLEPQCVVILGEFLLSRGSSIIIPTYAAALLDLGFDHEAYDVCRPLWSHINWERKPQIIARTLHRACRLIGDTELQAEIEAFADGKFDIGGPRTAFPSYLRKSRRDKLDAFRQV